MPFTVTIKHSAFSKQNFFFFLFKIITISAGKYHVQISKKVTLGRNGLSNYSKSIYHREGSMKFLKKFIIVKHPAKFAYDKILGQNYVKPPNVSFQMLN